MKKIFIIAIILFLGCGTKDKKVSPQLVSSLETEYSTAMDEINTYDTILVIYQTTKEGCLENPKLDQMLKDDSRIVAYTMYLSDRTLECLDFERTEQQTCEEKIAKNEPGDKTCIVVANFK